MLMCNASMFMGPNNSISSASPITDIKSITIQNCIIDTFFLSNVYNGLDVHTDPVPPIPSRDQWYYETIINAVFQGTLEGGNVDYPLSQVKKYRVRRSETGKFDWTIIHEHTVDRAEDLQFQFMDFTARSNQDYTYAAVPVWDNDIEGPYSTVETRSEFPGLFFISRGGNYGAVMEVSLSTQINQTTSTIVTLGNKYPFVNRYGKSQYYSGVVNCCFVSINDSCDVDIDGGVKYRENVESMLLNATPKIIKFEDGRIWLASIVDAVAKDESDWYKLPVYSINFVEIGDWDSSENLLKYGFLDPEVQKYELLS